MFVIVAFALLSAYKEFVVLLIGTIDITDISTAEDVAVAHLHTFVRAYLTTIDTYFGLSEDVTVGIECAAFTEVVVASSTAKDVAMHMTFIEFHIGLACLVDTHQPTDTIVFSAGMDDATSNGSNLTASEEGVTHVASIHLHVSDIHTAVVDVATAEDTATVVQTVGAVTGPGLVVKFLLVVVRAYSNIVEVARGHCIEVSVADEALVERDIRGAEYGTTLATAVGVTLDGWDTVEEAVAVKLTNDDVCFAEDVIRRAFADGSGMIAHASPPTAAIDVTGLTALNIGMGAGNERVAKVVSGHVVFIVDRSNRTCGIEVLCHRTAQQGDVGGAMYVARIGRICITQTAAVGVCSAKTAIVHIATDISTFVNQHVGVVFLAISGYCQIIV